MELTEDQSKALKSVLDFIYNEKTNKTFALTGPAGSGKTTLIRTLLSSLKSDIEEKKISVAFCAPTHKACRVIRKLADIKVSTLHSLLGLEYSIDEKTGLEVFKKSFRDRNQFGSYDVVIIDECSMISKELFKYIEEEYIATKVKIVFIGDKCQLPPVNEPESITLNNVNFTLDKVIRQAQDNPIIKLVTEIRQEQDKYKFKYPPTLVIHHNNKGIEFVVKESEFLSKAIDIFKSQQYQFDPDYCKVICYTNKTVNFYNSYIRSQIIGENAPEYVEGEFIIVNQAISTFNTIRYNRFQMPDYKNNQIIFNASDDLLITRAEKKTMVLFGESYFALLFTLRYSS